MHRLSTAIFAGGFLLLSLSTLGGCGQIGPLYFPESEPVGEPEAQAETIAAPAPVPEHTKPEQPVQAEQPSN